MTDKKALIIGTGMTGTSVMRFLTTQKIDFDVYAPNSNPLTINPLKKHYPKAIFYIDPLDKVHWENINQVIISPGVPPNSDIVKKALSYSIPVHCDLELFSKKQTLKPIIAVTGTNGKSTLVTLITALLKSIGLRVALAGNIGQPMLDTLGNDFDVWVLELSSFQLHYQISLSPTITCLLNISEDHINWHGSYENYQQAKHKIYHEKAINIFNDDDRLTSPSLRFNAVSFSLKGSNKAKFKLIDTHFYRKKERLFTCSDLLLSGTHNYEDILAALAVVDAFGMKMTDAISPIKKFNGLEHRTQFIKKINGLSWINDSKGTNVGATLAALKGIGKDKRTIIWLAGGMGKGADFAPLAPTVEKHVRDAILFGEDKNIIAKAIEKSKVPITFVKTLKEAIEVAQKKGAVGDDVLLSPACASFDMYDSYIKRGEAFTALVHLIK